MRWRWLWKEFYVIIINLIYSVECQIYLKYIPVLSEDLWTRRRNE